jgi:hypothetical protein
MTREEITNSQDYKATKIALDWWYSLPEEQRKATDIDAEPDIVDAYSDGVIYGWNNPNWISVEERLPEKDNEFEDYSKLVVVTDGKDFYKGMYNYGGECWLTHDLWPIEDATYWMEVQLPQPPRKEDKK